jgi:sugar phosphate isomerase/epimerase
MFKNLSPGAINIRCSWVEGLDLARAAGFQGADLNVGEAQAIAREQGVEAVRRLYEERGLKPGGWGLPVNWRGDDRDFSAGLEQLPAAAELAAAVGSYRTSTWVLAWSDDLPRQEHFDRVVPRFRAIAGVLKGYGHSLGLEFIGPRTSRAPHRYGFVYTMDGMLTLCSAIGTGNVGLLFDGWHWYTCQSTLDDVRQLRKEDVVYVHLNDAPAGVDVLEQVDNQRCLPGETGVIPNRDLLAILHEIGYDGPVTVEPFNARVKEVAARDPLEAARITSQALDRVWDW